MHPALELFLSIAKEYTDLTFGRSKDELISRSIKALRAMREEDLEKVKENKELSSGVEFFLERFASFVKEHPEDVETLIKLLSLFIKSPVPCKIRLINFSEVLVEGRRASQE
ncbi:MAG: hypothetical protein GU344_00590 [Thermocrinis sp.]|jgi:hypothetical protein|nr:hypothetical protein [Thermocrinis sp.]